MHLDRVFIVAASLMICTSMEAQPVKKVAQPAPKAQPASAPSIPEAPKDWDKEPAAFLGIKLGEKFEVPGCPTMTSGTYVKTESLDYQATRALDHVCFDPTGRPMAVSAIKGYRLANLPDLGIGYSAFAKVKDGIVTEVTIELKQHSFGVLLEAFTQRYGSPTVTDISELRTIGGGDFASRELAWVGKKLSIKMYERFSKVDESFVLITDNATMAAENAARKAKLSVEAQKF